MGEKKQTNKKTLSCTPSSWELPPKYFLLGNLHLHSPPRKLHVHWHCASHVDWTSRTSQREGLCRPKFSPARPQPQPSHWTDSYRRHWWVVQYAMLLLNQFKRKYNRPIYKAQNRRTHDNGRCFKSWLGEFLKESETRDFPSGHRTETNAAGPVLPPPPWWILYFSSCKFSPVFFKLRICPYVKRTRHALNWSGSQEIVTVNPAVTVTPLFCSFTSKTWQPSGGTWIMSAFWGPTLVLLITLYTVLSTVPSKYICWMTSLYQTGKY